MNPIQMDKMEKNSKEKEKKWFFFLVYAFRRALLPYLWAIDGFVSE